MWRGRGAEGCDSAGGIALFGYDLSMTMILWQRDKSQYGDAMMLSLYVTLGILLLVALRNPSANRSLIAYAASSSFAHATVMAVMAFRDTSERALPPGVTGLVVIGVALIVLAPAKQSVGQDRWRAYRLARPCAEV